ncbi:MAG: NAD(P)-dependent oxidoreductase [Roseicyclus sp.]
MRILLLGATGRTGRRVRDRLEAQAHEVITYGRRPGGGMRAVTGPLDDVAGLRAALDGADGAVSCLASSNSEPVCSTATRTLIEATERPLRYVIVSGASVEMPGDVRGPFDRAMGWLFRLFFGGMLRDRQAELDQLRSSHLAWTALRPPRLTESAGRGVWRFDHDRPHALRISRDDLAGAIVEALHRDDLARSAPFVSEAGNDAEPSRPLGAQS